MRVLLDGSAGVAGVPAADPGLPELAQLYAVPPGLSGAGRWLRANMVTTLDGAAFGADSRSGSINTPADRVVFELIRALSDAVIVGAGTVRAEGYSPLRVAPEYAALRASVGRRPPLPLVVVSNSGRLPEGLAQQSSTAPVLAVVPSRCRRLAQLRDVLGQDAVIVAGADEVDLVVALAAVADRGWPHLLTEGGPRLLGRLLQAGLVDELDLTIAPSVTAGEASRVVTGPALAPPSGFRLLTLLEQDHTVLGRWLRD
ncbi:MAG: deaminase [Actinomycetales bacterium]|nr:MAG: deaminase [Actinomycetales bacterium]